MTGHVPLERLISRRLPLAVGTRRRWNSCGRIKGPRQGRHGMDRLALARSGKALDRRQCDPAGSPAGQCPPSGGLANRASLLKLGRAVCYFDPFLSPEASRQVRRC